MPLLKLGHIQKYRLRCWIYKNDYTHSTASIIYDSEIFDQNCDVKPIDWRSSAVEAVDSFNAITLVDLEDFSVNIVYKDLVYHIDF
jgi:hypothetical protein